MWCWQRLLRVPETVRKSSWSILKEIDPDYSLAGLMLKLQYFGHLMPRADSLGKTLMLGNIEGKTRSGQQRTRGLESTTDSVDMNLSKFWETVRDKGAWCATVPRVTESDMLPQTTVATVEGHWVSSCEGSFLCSHYSSRKFYGTIFPFPLDTQPDLRSGVALWPSFAQWNVDNCEINPT